MRTTPIVLLLSFLLPVASFSQDYHTCYIKVPEVRNIDGAASGVFNYSYKWTNGSVIKVKFSGGSSTVRSKIRQYAKIWENYANITFDFIEYGTPDILVAFDRNSGSWSYPGTYSKTMAAGGSASMNFGWFNDYTADSELKRTTLHEFGHALGLLHEHSNPSGNIQWNKPVVYNYYQAQGWTRQKVDDQIFQKYDVELSNRKYDSRSIMHYPIPREFTTNGYYVDMNYDLSEGDKQFISELYPKSRTTTTTTTTTTSLRKMACNLENIDVEHNITNLGRLGMKLFLSFTIDNAQYKNCTAAAYYYDSNDNALKDSNRSYYTTTGCVAVSNTFTPNYPSTRYTRYELFMPYDELEMADGEYNLKFKVSIWSDANQELIQSGSYYFTYSKGIICNDIEVLNSFESQNSRMVIMPKFTVKNGQNVTCNACVYFYFDDAWGNPLKDNYGNALSFCQYFTPAYTNTMFNSGYYSDLYMYVPYSSINIPYGTYKLKYFVALFNGSKQFATSKWYYTSFTRS